MEVDEYHLFCNYLLITFLLVFQLALFSRYSLDCEKCGITSMKLEPLECRKLSILLLRILSKSSIRIDWRKSNMITALILLVVFLGLMISGVPIPYAMIATSIFTLKVVLPEIPLVIVPQRIVSGVNNYILLCIPF